MLPVSQTVLPAPADWLLMPITQALEIVEKGEAIPLRHVRAIRDLLPFVAAHPTGCLGGPGPRREECLLDISKFFLLETDLQNDAELGRVLMSLLSTYIRGGALHFDRHARGAFAVWLQLAEQYAAASFGDPVFSAYVCTCLLLVPHLPVCLFTDRLLPKSALTEVTRRSVPHYERASGVSQGALPRTAACAHCPRCHAATAAPLGVPRSPRH